MKKLSYVLFGLIFCFGLIGCKNNKTDLDEILNTIKTEYIKENIDSNLSIPSVIDGASISIESSDNSVINNNGEVNRQSEDKIVYITITVTKDNEKKEEIIKVTVLKDDSQVIINPPVDDTKLSSDQIKLVNDAIDEIYKYNYKMVDVSKTNYGSEEYNDTYTVSYYDNIEYFVYGNNEDEFYVEYVSEESANLYCLNQEGTGFDIISSDDEDFSTYLYLCGYYSYNFDAINTDYLSFKDNKFEVNKDHIKEVCDEFFGYEDTNYDYFRFSINDGKISSLEYKYSYEDSDEENNKINVVVVDNTTFSDYGKISLKLPETGGSEVIEDSLGTSENPLSVEEAISIISKYANSGDESSEQGYVKGTVKSITGPDKYSSYSIYLEAGSNTFQIYSLKLSSNQSAPKVNDVIVVKGYFEKYVNKSGNVIYEVAYSSNNKTNPTLVRIEDSGEEIVDNFNYGTENNPINVSDAIEILKALGVGNKISYVSGVIKTTPALNSKGNYDFYLEAGENSFQVYSCVIDNEIPEIGDSVIIKGFLLMYNNIYEIGYSSSNKTNPTIVSVTSVVKTNLLTTNKSSVSVNVEDEIIEALNQLTITYYDNEGNKSFIDSTKYTIETDYKKDEAGTYNLSIKYNGLEVKVSIISKAKGVAIKSPNALKLNEAATSKGAVIGIPSTGDVNVLVIPLAFSNKSYDSDYKEKLDIVFNGTSEQTGYESLKSYYLKSSYGKLNLTATILDAYNTNYAYNSSDTGEVGKTSRETIWLNDALSFYDNSVDYSKFDLNKDGYIDCVYLVYLADYSTNDDSFYWAYTTYTDNTSKYDNTKAGCYIFLSYEFMNEAIKYYDYGASKDTFVSYNAVTFIHETGHALGLDDYYDYGTNNKDNGGLGGADMMDHNIIDHNIYSKAVLGWCDPYIVYNGDCEVTINSATETGEGIIVPKTWSENGSYYTEMYLIEFYTNTNLNEFFAGYDGTFTKNGVRIYHIDSTIVDENISEAYDVTKYHNSNDNHKLISLVEADGNNSISKTGISSDSDLFMANSSYSASWYNSSATAFTIEVLEINSENAKISIKF